MKGVLLDLLKVDPGAVYCLQQNMAAKAYDLTLVTAVTYKEALKRAEEKKAKDPLRFFNVSSLERKNFKITNIHTYNPYVTEEKLGYFLSRYAQVLPGVWRMRDGYGIWIGKRQFRGYLKPDPGGHDGLMHPQAFYSIRADRGYLYYSGQPLFCRQCRRTGHMGENCSFVRCRNCGKCDHTMGECPDPKHCHGCGGEGHIFRDCPSSARSYASAAAGEGPPGV